MKNSSTITRLLLKPFLLSLIFVFSSCQKEELPAGDMGLDASAKSSPASQKGEATIAEIVVSSAENEEQPQFTLLLAALNYAGITSMFTESNQYTVFAPTDAAFRTFLGDKALSDFTPEQVAAVLSYHVTDGRRFSNSVVPKNSPRQIQTLLGLPIYVDSNLGIDTNDADSDPNAFIDNPNVAASNGVIHVITEVLVPVTD